MRLGDSQKKRGYSNSISLPLVDDHSSFIHNDHKLDSYTLSINNRMDKLFVYMAFWGGGNPQNISHFVVKNVC